jgi:uncharacterized membrane protein
MGVFAYYLAAVLFYVSDLLQKRSSENRSTWSYIFYRSIYTSIITFLLALFVHEPLDDIDIASWAQMIFSAMVCVFGLYFYIQSLKTSRFSNVGALSVVGNPLQWILGVVFFHNSWSGWDVIVMTLLGLGSVIQILNVSSFSGARNVLLSALFWTIGYSMLSDAVINFPISWSVCMLEWALLVLSFFFMRMGRGQEQIKFRVTPRLRNVFLALGVIIFMASYANHFSYKYNDLVDVSMYQLSVYPIFYLLSLSIFREKPSLVEWITFVSGLLGLIGMVTIQFFVI